MTDTGSPASYDDDFYAWTQQQAAALRQAPSQIVGNAIDIEHVAEEIEDLGKRDLREVRSFLKRLFEHLIKIEACSGSVEVLHWRSEAQTFASLAWEPFTESMRQLLDVEPIWRSGVKLASRYLDDVGVVSDLPETCPFSLGDVLTDNFDLDAALAKLSVTRTAPRDGPLP